MAGNIIVRSNVTGNTARIDKDVLQLLRDLKLVVDDIQYGGENLPIYVSETQPTDIDKYPYVWFQVLSSKDITEETVASVVLKTGEMTEETLFSVKTGDNKQFAIENMEKNEKSSTDKTLVVEIK